MNKNQLQNKTVYEIQRLVNKTKIRKLLSFFLIAITTTLIIYLILNIIFINANLDTNLNAIISIGIFTIATLLFLRSKPYTQLNTINIVEHINRLNPGFEESAQLLLIDTEQLSLIQSLQFNKIKNLFDSAINDRSLARCLPAVKFKLATWLGMIALILYFSSGKLTLWSQSLFTSNTNNPQLIEDKNLQPTVPSEPKLIDNHVKIIPPIYTHLPINETKDLNLTVAENSQIQWLLNFQEIMLNTI